MRNTFQSFRKTLYSLIAVGCLPAAALVSYAADMAEGLAFATSVKGSIQITDTEGQRAQPNLHDTLTFNESTIETGKNAHIFFALSNGIGIGIGQNSEVIFETYVQQPFPARKERLSYEPSVSILSIRLVTGSLAVASNKLSPLSQARIHLPSGELRIRSATCIVQNDQIGSRITAYEGTITYYYPDDEGKEFIVEPQSIRISPQSAKLGRVTESTTLASLPEGISQFSKATQQASKRVLFKAGYDGNPPRAVLLAAPAFYNQPRARPYEFND
ncbi:MAG: hypothetical protein ACI8Z5_000911 [Lentimonas sp.]|jgi:hypothetical protein